MSGSAPHIPGCRDLALIGERVARSLFSAVSDRTGGAVTVTVFPPLGDGRTMDGFERAAATAQRLGAHPSVVTIHEWGLAPDNRPWIVTEPQPAESVDTLLTMDGPLSVERALQVGILLAGALETAHRAGIVHGDLSPSRLVFGPQGEPLLAETGLAEYAAFPGLGALNNPVRYHAPPEVLERTEIGPETDVYSLATIVYALLAGRAPQQKPAEITDSNASLLLRILQMAVPPIERPDLPPGLDDALRGPLSPNPDSRPQQVIDLAWLLQDVQRRAGYAITQPVVLDLDDLDAGNRSVRAPATTASALGLAHGPDAGQAPAEPWGPTGPPAESPWAASGPPAASPWAASGPPAESPWAASPPATSAPADDRWSHTDAPAARSTSAPWGPEATDEVSPWAPDAPADPPSPWAPGDESPPDSSPWAAATSSGPPSSDRAPVAPQPDVEIEPPAPPPTIFPFAEGVDDHAGDGTPDVVSPAQPAQDAPDQPLWPSSPPADDAAKGSLWPSSWPADQDATETPAWAAPPPDDPAPAPPTAGPPADDQARPPLVDPADLPRAGVGGDGGSIGDVAGLPGTNGADPPAPSAAAGFGSTGRPPELDELPAWYTDPLPNDPPAGAGRGHDSSTGTPFSPVVGNGLGNGNGNGHADPTRTEDGPDVTGWPVPPSATSAPTDEALPGSGNELRSLFGEVVGDPGGPAPELPRRSSADPATHDRGLADADPLGPPGDRPPIDLSRLDAPLGPSPYLPPAARPDTDAPAPWDRPRSPDRSRDGAHPPANRLPRRHEVHGWQDHADAPGTAETAPPRLPRAAEHDSGFADADRPPRLERAVPRQVVGGDDPPASRAANAGPPAMPVIVLVAVVVVLLLGVIWLVVTGSGDEASPATTETTETTVAADPAAPAAPGEVAVTAVPEGFEVTWAGGADSSFVVTVLSADQPPRPLPATVGSSALVTSVDLGPGGHCFTVTSVSPAGEATGPASAPACTPGTTPDAVQAG